MSNPGNDPIPYAKLVPPSPVKPSGKPGDKQYAPCPSCGEASAKKVGWTIWGGALGPAMLTHVKCQDCGTTFNGKTGRSNSTAIAIYLVVSFAIVAAIGIVFAIAKS